MRRAFFTFFTLSWGPTPATTILCLLAAMPARAQSTARFSLDSAVSVDAFRGDNVLHRPNIVVDVSGVVRLSDQWLLYVRPWFRQPRTNEWDKEIYQAALQYQRPGRVATRIDVGWIASPVGLGMMDTRPGVNPTILPHLTYLVPMPAFDAGAPRIQPIAATYPFGGQLTLSGTKWDARGGLLNSAPTRIFEIGQGGGPHSAPFVEMGAGITPTAGLRFGLSLGRGDYVAPEELKTPSLGGRSLTQVGLEGEYAFAYTKISGEVVRDTLETSTSTAAASEWFVQGVQTLSPRWFVAARHEGTSAPGLPNAAGAGLRTTFRVTEGTVGFRLSPELTLRSSFVGRKPFTRHDWDRQVGVSVVWTYRWW